LNWFYSQNNIFSIHKMGTQGGRDTWVGSQICDQSKTISSKKNTN